MTPKQPASTHTFYKKRHSERKGCTLIWTSGGNIKETHIVEIKETYIVEIRGDAHRMSMDRYHHISTEKLISEYLKYMPEFHIGESPAETQYMRAIDSAMKREMIKIV